MNKGIISEDLLPESSLVKQLPPTIYQLNWLRKNIDSLPIDSDFLMKYDTFETIDQLTALRRKVLDELEIEPVWGILKHQIKRAEIVFIR